MFAYEYRYDNWGHVEEKILPGRPGRYHHHGLRGGPLDEMVLYYTGNQLRAITSYACPDDFEDYTPYPVSDSENAYFCDQNGNTTKDLDRNILSIQYNLLNLPR